MKQHENASISKLNDFIDKIGCDFNITSDIYFNIEESKFSNIVINAISDFTGIKLNQNAIKFLVDDETTQISLQFNEDIVSEEQCEVISKEIYNVQEEYCFLQILLEKLYGLDSEANVYVNKYGCDDDDNIFTVTVTFANSTI